MNSNDPSRKLVSEQKGAALVTVLLVSVLLLTASIALLSAVAANSRNSTDVLSETKAYYAAESGLQAAINELRHDCSATYAAAAEDSDMSTWLPYNVTTLDNVSANVVGQTAAAYMANQRAGSAYTIQVSDPDNIGGTTTFNTVGKFQDRVVVGNSNVAINGTLGCSGACVTYGTTPNRTTIYIDAQTPPTVDFSNYQNPPVTAFRIENEVGGTGSPISDDLRFEVSYRMTDPTPAAAKTIIGSITKQTLVSDPVRITFAAREYTLKGSYINMCTTSTCSDLTVQGPCVFPRSSAAYGPITLTPAGTTTIYANLTPVEPARIMIQATGYGPNRSLKKLEAIIKRDFFDGLGSTPAISMVGPNGPGFRFEPGTSTGVSYSGVGGPSFGLTNSTNLSYLQHRAPGCNSNQPSPCGDQSRMQPPPAMISDIPSWQQSPTAMDALVQELRTTAQGSGTYYAAGSTISNPGNFSSGTGITFCEGNCQVGGSGGGILVVTGKLTNTGGFSFRGLILVTGAGGWDRNGGGNGVVTGSIVIAPYDAASLACTPQTVDCFLPPQYYISGGGSSDVVSAELGVSFDGTSAATDFVQGVAEK
jgi:Tfp pilus assembly protein PilX